jgi:hypothetical protein
MGGRSREGHQLTDRWKWIGELSEERFNNYAKYSQIQASEDRKNGVNGSAANLNFQLAKFYESKHGSEPSWSNWRSI